MRRPERRLVVFLWSASAFAALVYAIYWLTITVGPSRDDLARLYSEYQDTQQRAEHPNKSPKTHLRAAPKVRSHPDRVLVPDVTGLDGTEAVHHLLSLGLKVSVSRQGQAGVPPGRVLSQDPAAGTKLPPGGPVTVTVCGTPGPVTLPDFKGEAEAAARAKLLQSGVLVERVLHHDMRVPPGYVIKTVPQPGSKMPSGATVKLIVSAGKPTGDIVPDLEGLTFYDARAVAGQSSMALEVIGDASAEDDYVVKSQDPQPGTDAVERIIRVTLGPAPSPSPSASASPSPHARPH